MELLWIILISACAVISLVVLFLLISMDSIDPLQYGITINKITKNIGKDVYENGRYIIGPFTNFIRYPANLVTIEFSDNRQANVIKNFMNIIFCHKIRINLRMSDIKNFIYNL